MRIRNLNTFIKVAALGSFHAAAIQLNASQPAVSARIAALEEELGVILFKRDQSGTRITARGMQLQPYAEKLVAISTEMKAQLRTNVPKQGTLRIGIADTLAYLWLDVLLQKWREQYPLIQFELTIDLSLMLYKKLQQHQLDLALMVSSEQVSTLVTAPLCDYAQSWVTSVRFADYDKPLLIADLAQWPILSFPRHTKPWHYLQQLFQPLNVTPKFHTSNSVSGLLALAEQGAGITLLPELLVKTAISESRLVRLEVKQQPPSLSFCSGWRQDEDRILPQLLARSARQLIDKHRTS